MVTSYGLSNTQVVLNNFIQHQGLYTWLVRLNTDTTLGATVLKVDTTYSGALTGGNPSILNVGSGLPQPPTINPALGGGFWNVSVKAGSNCLAPTIPPAGNTTTFINGYTQDTATTGTITLATPTGAACLVSAGTLFQVWSGQHSGGFSMLAQAQSDGAYVRKHRVLPDQRGGAIRAMGDKRVRCAGAGPGVQRQRRGYPNPWNYCG